MAERPPATDLRGGNASEDSLTRFIASFVVAYAVDFQSDFFSGTAPVSVVRPGGFRGLLSSLPGMRRIRSELVSEPALCEAMGLDESTRIRLFPYRWIPDHEGPKGLGPPKSRCQPEDLELIPRDVVRPGRLHFDLRLDQSRSWLCFGFDDKFLVDGGILVASYFRGANVDGGAITDG